MTVEEQDLDGGHEQLCDDAGRCTTLLIRFQWEPVDEDGSVVDNEWEHHLRTTRAHREVQAAPSRGIEVAVKNEPTNEVHASEVHAEAVPAAAAPVAQIAVPSPATAAHEIAGIANQAGGANGLSVALAAIAVLGGGAGWKFYSQWAKQKHEERMAEIERGPRTDDESRKRCDGHAQESRLAVANVEAKLDSFARRLDALEASKQEISSSMTLGDNVEERVSKLEKALKVAKRRATTSGR